MPNNTILVETHFWLKQTVIIFLSEKQKVSVLVHTHIFSWGGVCLFWNNFLILENFVLLLSLSFFFFFLFWGFFFLSSDNWGVNVVREIGLKWIEVEMGLISGILMGMICGIGLMAVWKHMTRYRSNKRIAKVFLPFSRF